MRSTVSLVAVAIILTSLPAVAWHGSTEPLLDEVAFSAPRWAAWRVALASPGSVTIEAFGSVTDMEIAALGGALMPADGPTLGSAWVVAQAPTSDVFIQTRGEAPVVDIKEDTPTGTIGAALTWHDVPAGESVVVAVWTSIAEATSGAIELRAHDATILGATEGTTTIAALARDFSGEVNVLASRSGYTNAVAIVDAARTETVSENLFAFYWRHPSTSAHPTHSVLCSIGYDGPNGGGAGAQYYFIEDAPPGAYTFRVSHCVDAGAGPFRTQLFILGAAVKSP